MPKTNADKSSPRSPHATDTAAEAQTSPQELCCSFCGKAKNEVAKMIAGPNVYICNECIAICNAIITDSPECGP